MVRKFLIILCATVFYNGVTESSPVDVQQISDIRLPEEKPPTGLPPTVDHINSPVSTVKPSDPISKGVVQPPEHTEAKTNNSASAQPPKTTPPLHTEGSNTTTISKANGTQLIDNKAANHSTAEKNATQAPDIKNGTEPTHLPAVKNSTEVPIPNSTDSSTPVSSTPTSTASTPTTIKATNVTPTTVKPAVTSPSDSGITGKESMISGQNTPAQEKHFDGASFVGGIVLTIGLTAIGFVAFKYYKSGKIDMNYRTL